jgi:predicted Abi (CAAX) family protease
MHSSIRTGFRVYSNNIIQSIFVRLTIQGGISIVQSLCCIGTVTIGCTMMGWTKSLIQLPQKHKQPDSTSYDKMLTFGKVFVRVLFVPSLCEELIWRVVLQPPKSTIIHIIMINSLYTISHIGHAMLLQQWYHTNSTGNRSTSSNRNTIDTATVHVFTNPTFLFISFILGNVCSYSYIRSGYALYAPVFIHTMTVSIWLSLLGGNTVLGREQ